MKLAALEKTAKIGKVTRALGGQTYKVNVSGMEVTCKGGQAQMYAEGEWVQISKLDISDGTGSILSPITIGRNSYTDVNIHL